MSLPPNERVAINIAIPAGAALSLAHQINYLLSRVKDFQDAQLAAGTNQELRVGEGFSDANILLSMLERINVAEGVTLTIIPDMRTPGSSGYGYYSVPGNKQYVPPPDKK